MKIMTRSRNEMRLKIITYPLIKQNYIDKQKTNKRFKYLWSSLSRKIQKLMQIIKKNHSV